MARWPGICAKIFPGALDRGDNLPACNIHDSKNTCGSGMFGVIFGSFIDLMVLYKVVTKLIVCLTGMPGAGKSTIASGLELKGYDVINMGDAVRREARKRNVEPTGANLGKLMLELRERDGPGAIAGLVKGRIESSASDVVLIDGVRSSAEIDVLRGFGNLKLLAVHASVERRFDLLQKRGRSDDPQTKKHFEDRDSREMGVGISGPIVLSDHAITNLGLTKDELVAAAFGIIQSWMK